MELNSAIKPIPMSMPVRQNSATPVQTLSRKRFQNAANPYIPEVHLNREGNITHLTDAASRLLEYSKAHNIDPCFFAHVHGRNLYQVMRDVADMVRYSKPESKWLLRLQTGKGRWRWYRAQARNKLNEDEPRIEVKLHDLHDW